MDNMYVFDLDGTVDLTDPRLTAKILRMSKSGTIFVTATGRTNRYVKEACKKNGIMPPRYIVADNGGTIYDNVGKRYITKTALPIETRRKLLESYIRFGGIPADIRYADGDNVFASKAEDVRKYYEDDTIIEHREAEELIKDILSEESEITKLTLVGSKKMMKQIIEFVRKEGINCWTDFGTTKFPNRARKNYRLDIMDGEVSKGKAVKFLSEYIGVREFTCIGNGLNDLSMFRYALDCGLPVVVVNNHQETESADLIEKVQAYAEKVGQSDKINIVDFPVNSSIDSIYARVTAKQKRAKFVKELKLRGESKVDTTKKGCRNTKINVRER